MTVQYNSKIILFLFSLCRFFFYWKNVNNYYTKGGVSPTSITFGVTPRHGRRWSLSAKWSSANFFFFFLKRGKKMWQQSKENSVFPCSGLDACLVSLSNSVDLIFFTYPFFCYCYWRWAFSRSWGFINQCLHFHFVKRPFWKHEFQ